MKTVRGMRAGVLVAVFAAGFGLGAMTARDSASAQLGELGKEALKQAGGSGGALGSATQLGTAIVEMEQHVNGLQKNIDVLKTVKAGLGG